MCHTDIVEFLPTIIPYVSAYVVLMILSFDRLILQAPIYEAHQVLSDGFSCVLAILKCTSMLGSSSGVFRLIY